MSDFLIKAKDLYFRDPEKYGHFRQILATIDEMHKAKSYYEVDLFNIEEILSILDMSDFVAGSSRAEEFVRFIKDVILAYTRDVGQTGLERDSVIRKYFANMPLNFYDLIFGSGPWSDYGFFVFNLGHVSLSGVAKVFDSRKVFALEWSAEDCPDVEYSVVTLNYDLVLETPFRSLSDLVSNRPTSPRNESLFRVAKLHGSIDKELVAPTWKKWIVPGLDAAWKLAHEVLSNATKIRILGYSLPTSDTYVRYLLESAVIRSSHLKEIDVICRDDDSRRMQKHYEDFVKLRFFRFKNADISDYISRKYPDGGERLSTPSWGGDVRGVHFNRLEEAHEKFMES